MRTVTLELDEETATRIEADGRARGVTFEQAAADHFHLLAYEAKHGPVDPADLADLDAAIAEADRGEFAPDEEVEAFFSRYRR